MGAFACAVSGCVSFSPPDWSAPVADTSTASGADTRYLSLNSRDDVEYYLRLHTRTYDRMISDAEAGRVLLELPVVGAAVAIPAGLALGKSDKFAIRVATAGAAGSAGSTWIQPRQRIVYAAQAREAVTCVRREYAHQHDYQATLQTLVSTSIHRAALSSMRAPPTGRVQVPTDPDYATATNTLAHAWSVALRPLGGDNQGRVAVAAADEIVSRLKSRLANIGAAPDFSAILKTIQSQYESARAKTEAATVAAAPLAQGDSDALMDAAERVAEYPARVAECVAKVP